MKFITGFEISIVLECVGAGVWLPAKFWIQNICSNDYRE